MANTTTTNSTTTLGRGCFAEVRDDLLQANKLFFFSALMTISIVCVIDRDCFDKCRCSCSSGKQRSCFDSLFSLSIYELGRRRRDGNPCSSHDYLDIVNYRGQLYHHYLRTAPAIAKTCIPTYFGAQHCRLLPIGNCLFRQLPIACLLLQSIAV